MKVITYMKVTIKFIKSRLIRSWHRLHVFEWDYNNKMKLNELGWQKLEKRNSSTSQGIQNLRHSDLVKASS